MKFKIVSMLVVLGFLSVMPLIYTGKLDPATFFDKLHLDTDQIGSRISQLKVKVPDIGGSSEVKVYKWRDVNGVMQFGSQPPPAGANFEQVLVNINKNVVDSVKIPAKEESEKVAHEVSAPSPYSVKGMKKVLEDARGVEDLLKKSQEDREKLLGSY